MILEVHRAISCATNTTNQRQRTQSPSDTVVYLTYPTINTMITYTGRWPLLYKMILESKRLIFSVFTGSLYQVSSTSIILSCRLRQFVKGQTLNDDRNQYYKWRLSTCRLINIDNMHLGLKTLHEHEHATYVNTNGKWQMQIGVEPWHGSFLSTALSRSVWWPLHSHFSTEAMATTRIG